MKWLVRIVLALAVLGFAGWLGLRAWLGPDPAEVLDAIALEPPPVLEPAAEQATFRLAPGFRAELVAAEPLVVDPVAIDWDEAGRLYVVEMRGFMRDLDASGEDAPSGRIVVLEDVDGDGAMDRSRVFLDGLVLPRAVAALPEGVLVGAPPDLLLCRDEDADLACDAPVRVGHYGLGRHDPEHLENGLLPAIDGWIYNAKSRRRFRFGPAGLEVAPTLFRGQWGVAQDDEGRLFANHNSAWLLGDVFASDALMRHPASATHPSKAGVGVSLGDGVVHGVRHGAGLNRAYVQGQLRADGRQRTPTAVSGLAIQRSDGFGPEYRGDVFVPEAAGAAVARLTLERDGLALRAVHRTVADPDWGEREFLASDHERFRPVSAAFGPDGALYVVDMYRGVIQHANYVSEHLREYVLAQGLEAPGETGRIWRIVRDAVPRPAHPPDVSRLPLAEQVAALDHPNGWLRDRAQRRIVHDADPGAADALRVRREWSEAGRVHALWTLAGLGALDDATFADALADPRPAVRRAVLRAGAGRTRADAILAATRDDDEAVALQALHALGELPPDERPLEAMLALAARGAIWQQAVLSGLTGLESEALARVLEDAAAAGEGGEAAAWIGELAAAWLLAARDAPTPEPATVAFLDAVATLPEAGERAWQRDAVLDGIATAMRRPELDRVELAGPHPLFAALEEGTPSGVGRLERVRRSFTWPGDPRPGGARALTPEEEVLRARGADLYAASCVSCHGVDGRGQTGLAPSLVASPWVLDADDWLARIVLQGLAGPLVVDDVAWNAVMPPHRHDPRFDDATLAGLMTHLRRSWGNAGEPVTPEAVARVRAASADRTRPWTVEELLALEDVSHRFDRYVGLYAVPVVALRLEVGRRGTALTFGMAGGPSGELVDLGGGTFAAEGVTVAFVEEPDGRVREASVLRDGTHFTIERED